MNKIKGKRSKVIKNNISRLLSKFAAKYPELLPLFLQDKVKQDKIDKAFEEAWVKVGKNYNKK